MAEMETPQGIRFELIERQQSFPCDMPHIICSILYAVYYMQYMIYSISYAHRNENYKLNILYHQKH